MPVNTNDISELIQTSIARILVKPLEAASTFLSAGVRIFDTASPLSVPKLSGSFSPGWIGESELIPEDDGAGFDAVTLLPSTMKSLKTLIRFSNESLRESVLNLDSVLQDRLVKDVQGKLDAHAWSADGDGVTTPLGVLSTANKALYPTLDSGGAALTLDKLHDAIGIFLEGDVPLSGARWVMSPKQLTGLRKLKTGTNSYALQPDLTAGNGFALLGIPVTVSKRLPLTGAAGSEKEQVLLWNPSSWAVARDLSPQAVVLRERFAEFDEVGLRIVTRFDWKPLQPEANVLIKNVA